MLLLRSGTSALVVLTLINLFNYIDRYVMAAVQERIKHDLALSDTEIGLLASSFVIVYMLTSPLFGRAGDTRSRKGIVALGIAIWSVATAGAGLARSFAQLFVSRAAVGVGEAAYGTVSPSLLADFFPKERRGRVFAIFFAAIPIGSALGYVLGGAVEERFGWRAAFFIAGAPGLVLAGLALVLREPPRGEQDPGHVHAPAGLGKGAIEAYLEILKIHAYARTVAGYAAYTFALGGLAVWMPTFLVRVRGMKLGDATQVFGMITVVAGFVGTFGGGWIGDRLLARGHRQAYLLVSGIATALAVPATAVALLAPWPPVYYGAIFAAEVLLFASTSPVNAVIVNVVPVDMRATAVALSILTIHALGDAISPPIIGKISDLVGLENAVLVVPLAIAVSAAIWTGAALERK